MMRFIAQLCRSAPAAAGFAIVVLVTLAAIAAPLIMPYDPAAQDISQRLLPLMAHAPAGLHILGTDALGRDLLSRVIVSARVSLLVGVASVLVSGAVGVVLGLVAGYDERFIGRVLLGVADVQLAVPFLVLALAVVAVLGPSLLNIILVLGVTNWVQYARIVRAETLVLRDREFIQAALVLGASTPRVLFLHLLPNVMPSIVVVSGLQVARMILFEASLSYLGLGVPPQIPSWGGMILDGRNYMANAWWVAAIPGLAIFATVIAINLVGDRLRDMLDPKLRLLER